MKQFLPDFQLCFSCELDCSSVEHWEKERRAALKKLISYFSEQVPDSKIYTGFKNISVTEAELILKNAGQFNSGSKKNSVELLVLAITNQKYNNKKSHNDESITV